MKRQLIFSLLCLGAMSMHAQFTVGTFFFDNYPHTYDFHLPTAWTPGSQLPLVLDLHYLGADGRDEDSLTQFNPIADAEGFIICHPYGGSTDWNAGQNIPYAVGDQSVEYLSRLIDTMHVKYGADLDRIYVVGMGQGAFMVHRLSCDLAHRLAAIAAVSGSITDSAAYYCGSTRPMPLMIIHGTADSVVPYFTGLPGYWSAIPDLVTHWQGRDSCVGSPVVNNLPDLVQEGSTITTSRWAGVQGSELLLYEVVGGGFAWPGASRDLGSGGNRNMDINASQHIWDFFKTHRLSDGPLAIQDALGHDQQLHIYPQPTAQLLHVKMNDGEFNHLSIKNLQGIEMHPPMTKLGSSAANVDMSELPVGIYFLQIDDVVRRIVVMR